VNIVITGATGFVGGNLSLFFNEMHDLQLVSLRNRSEKLYNFSCDAIIHLAGKAHDNKKTASSEEYYKVNTELTISLFESFLSSDASVFITLSSVKAVADDLDVELTEDYRPSPVTHYGKSKLLAEEYILSRKVPDGKRVYVLRPGMIHGPGNRGNLNLLYKLIAMKIPWPLGSFENKRSYCSVDNLLFVIKEIIEREDIPSGVYNVVDDEPLSTNELIGIIAQSHNRSPQLWYISKKFIESIAILGDKFHLPLNSERLHKLTSSYVVSNAKIIEVIGKPLPVSSKEGLLKTFHSFKNQ